MDNLNRTKPRGTCRAAEGLKRKQQSGTFKGRSVETSPLRKATEDVVLALRPETVARVVISPSNKKITSLTRSAKVCISD
ncbi:hypothetical protein CRG98_024732 [Punica granatum]|uniref:Uncharacterized protein n=1 Tax=Punica granatum TaxID=22663 RepID=A0A2I0JF34_PUNGR|nr:hypothetical protein CRG98_024732 [Punica granatum]